MLRRLSAALEHPACSASLSKQEPALRSTLGCGRSGLLIALAYQARASGSEALRDKVLRRMIRAMHQSLSVPMSRSLLFGRAGVAWTAWLVDEISGSELARGYLPVILDLFRMPGGDGCAEWGSGHAGLLFMATELGAAAEDLAHGAVRALAKLATVRGAHAFWPAASREHGGRMLAKTGVAHGQAGVLLGLGRHLERHPRDERAAELLSQGARWLLSLRRSPRPRCEYPAWEGDERADGERTSGWCNGDLGVAAALHQAGRILGERGWMQSAEDTAQRLLCPLKEEAVEAAIDPRHREDPCLCHGVSGYALFALAFARWSGRKEFDRARHVLARRLLLLQRKRGPGRGNFLTGSIGAFLATGTLAGSFGWEWTRCLGLPLGSPG